MKLLLQVNDWNFQDRYYRVEAKVLREFLIRATQPGDDAAARSAAWGFLNQHTSATGKCKPLTRIDPREDSYFFDYNNPRQSAEESLESLAEQGGVFSLEEVALARALAS